MKNLPYITATIAVTLSLLLCVIAYILEHYIHSSVLWVLAQALLYAASIFDVTLIIHNFQSNENNK